MKNGQKLKDEIEINKSDNNSNYVIGSSSKDKNTNENSPIENLELNDCKISTIYFLISEFGLIFVLGFILLIIYLSPQYHPAKTFTSKNSNKIFDSNYIPKIFIHTTDIHITLNKPTKLDGSQIFMTSLLEYKPDSFLLTGDIVDNFIGKNKKMGGQNLEDWKVFNISIRSFLSKFNVIDVSGNHDLWAVKSPTSENNYFLDHSFMFNRENVKNEDDFFIKKIKKFDMTFLLLNDYRFPVIRPPYGAENHINKKQLDILENTINNLEEEECIILSHYPVDRAWLMKSSKGKTFQDIISNKKVAFLFTGHQHPKNVIIIHHGSEGGLEFCTSSAFDKKRAGLITIDNDNLVYHEVYIPYYGSKPLFFMTYPVPDDQVSSHHTFNLNNFEIRVISYASDNNIKLKIEGNFTGELNYEKTLNNGAFLYSYPVNLPDGIYNIHIYDENGLSCNINTTFIVGEKYQGKKEKYSLQTNFYLSARFFIIPFWIFLIIIILPIPSKYNFTIVKDIEYFIKGKKDIDIHNFVLFILLIILSPFFIRIRFQEITNPLKYALFIAFIYPLVLPIHFSENFDGIIGYTFFIFFVTKEKVIYEHWALQMTFIFYSGIIFPYVLFLSGQKYYSKKTLIITIINSAISIGLFIMAFLFNFISVNQSISFGFLFCTPAFIIIWLILLIFLIKFYY